MSKQWVRSSLAMGLLLGLSLSASAADDPALNKELLAVLASQKLPCDRIATVNTQAPHDYLVTCADGVNYQIVANSAGTLVAQPLGGKMLKPPLK